MENLCDLTNMVHNMPPFNLTDLKQLENGCKRLNKNITKLNSMKLQMNIKYDLIIK